MGSRVLIVEDTERIVGLELGADDYLPKPFNPRELLARMKAILRRAASPDREKAAAGALTIEAGGLTLNKARQTVWGSGYMFVDPEVA